MRELDGVLSDTNPNLQNLLWARLREYTPEEKLIRFAESCHFVRLLVITGIKERHPESSAEDIRKRYAAITLGPDLAARYYGWDRDKHGL